MDCATWVSLRNGCQHGATHFRALRVDRGLKVGHFRGVPPSRFALPSETFLQSTVAAPTIGLRRLNPGNRLLQLFTKLDSCVKKAFAGYRHVEVQLVSRRTTFEAAIDVPFQLAEKMRLRGEAE